jgi:hypothetical protein
LAIGLSFSLELTLGLVLQETVNLGSCAVVGANGVAVVSNVHDQVLTHNGQTDEAEISTGNDVRRSADIDAGETGAIVSEQCLLSIGG